MVKQPHKIKKKSESRAIQLVARILGSCEVVCNKGVFDWLRGDKNEIGDRKGIKLPVDAYFPDQKLVLEYHGKQHFVPNTLMERITKHNESRFAQRQRYTEYRRELIPKHGLKLLEIRYDEPLEIEHLKMRLQELGFNV